VLIIDDVISAGTAVRESIALIRAAGATLHAWPSRWTARRRPPKTARTCPERREVRPRPAGFAGLRHCQAGTFIATFEDGNHVFAIHDAVAAYRRATASMTTKPMNTAQTLRRARRLATLALLGGSRSGRSKAPSTCTDAQGRRITSDRPIAACIDRPQRAS
jgi:hypothetical protein